MPLGIASVLQSRLGCQQEDQLWKIHSTIYDIFHPSPYHHLSRMRCYFGYDFSIYWHCLEVWNKYQQTAFPPSSSTGLWIQYLRKYLHWCDTHRWMYLLAALMSLSYPGPTNKSMYVCTCTVLIMGRMWCSKASLQSLSKTNNILPFPHSITGRFIVLNFVCWTWKILLVWRSWQLLETCPCCSSFKRKRKGEKILESSTTVVR